MRNQSDTWYLVTANTDASALIEEMKFNLMKFILPHFDKVLSKEILVSELDKQTVSYGLGKLITFAGLGKSELARKEFQRLISQNSYDPRFLERVLEYGRKYNVGSK